MTKNTFPQEENGWLRSIPAKTQEAITGARTAERVIKTVADIPDSFSLVQDSQDVKSCLEYIGKLDELDDTGCLFVEYTDADIGEVYQCNGYVPFLARQVRKIR